MRECGECTLCCTLLPVLILNKPANTDCVHCHGKCDIHKSRPFPCRNYECMWLAGELPEAMRPDQSGIMLERMADDMVIVLQEDSSWLIPENLSVLESLVDKGNTVVLKTNETVHIKAPEGLDTKAEYLRLVDIAHSLGDAV